MYQKNLNHVVRVRIDDRDFEFLQDYSEKRDISISDTVRYLIGEYRRSVVTFEKIKESGLLD